MRSIRTYYTLILIFCTLCVTGTSMLAQDAHGVMTIRLVNRDGDTVVYKRSPSDWRIGPAISGTLHYHFGKLVMPVNPQYDCDGFYILDGGEMGGGGISGGVQFTYQPVGERWGLTFLGNIVDYRSTTTYTRIPGAPISPSYVADNTIISKVSVGYVSFMPQARYNIAAYPGLHVTIGADIDVKVSQSMQRWTTHYDLEQVAVVRNIPFEADNLRLGGSFGAGWDMFAGVLGSYRMTLTPFAALHLGSNIYSKNGSNWNSAYGQFGVALAFSEDVITEETVKRDIQATPPQVPVVVRADERLDIVMPESRGLNIEMLQPPSTPSVADAQPDASKTQNPTQTATPVNKIPFTGRISPNSMQMFSNYNNPLDTALSPKLKGYLDAIADYLRKNPTAEVRIVGHADNFGGTPTETQRVSDERALQVVRYLIRQGISRDRLLASGMGARTPIQNNRTQQGRAANRRVEITIVQ